MLGYLPRISIGIMQNLVSQVALTEWHTQSFRAFPLLDSDDFSMLAAPKYLEFAAIAGWTHAYRSGFLGAGIKEQWFVVNRRSYLELFRPVKVLKPFTIKTKLVAYDKFSTIRFVEFYQNKKLCAQSFMQHVVVNKNLGKIPTAEWVLKTGEKLQAFGPYPEECLSWKFLDKRLKKKLFLVKKEPSFPSSSLGNPLSK